MATKREEAPRRWLGAQLDIKAVKRDCVLAGGFSAANTIAGTMDPAWIIPGFCFGAVLGAVLHLMPAEPAPTDTRRGRITVRAISGFIGGAWAGFGVALFASGAAIGNAPMPSLASLSDNILLGGITGAAWYVAWGFWEMRHHGADGATVVPSAA